MKRMTWPAVGLMACMIAAVACRREEAVKKPLTPVRVAAVENYREGGGARYSATINPYAQVDISFRVGGYVHDILQKRGTDGRMRNVQEGDTVTKGTVLARIDTDDYLQRVNMARAELASASAGFEKAGQDFNRAKHLYATQSMTRPDYDTAKTRYDEAHARVEGDRAQLAEAEINLKYCDLKAPMDGVLLKRDIEAGTLAQPGRTAFAMADTRSVKAVFGIPDMMLQKVALGSPLSVTTESFPGVAFKGRITAISPSADSRSRVFEVEVTIPNPGNRLKAGMIGAIQLPTPPSARQVAVIPINAVVRAQNVAGGYGVFVVERKDGKSVVRLRNVKLGEVYGNRIEVVKGVNVGERVVVTGNTLVSDNDQVRVIP